MRENVEMAAKGYELPVVREISSEDLIHGVIITVNNTVLYTSELLRDLKCSHHTHTQKGKYVI